MLLLFAGRDYYPDGGWSDFVKTVGSVDELEIREDRETWKVPANPGTLVITSGGEERRGATPARTAVRVTRRINVRPKEHRDEYPVEFDWWHVVDSETLNIVASSSVEVTYVG